jgi:hypothetical protein
MEFGVLLLPYGLILKDCIELEQLMVENLN